MNDSSIQNSEIYSNNPETERVGIFDVEMDKANISGVKILDIQELSPEQEIELLAQGITTDELTELKTLIKEKPIEETAKVSKVKDWIGKVTAAMAARGIYDHVHFLDFVKGIFGF